MDQNIQAVSEVGRYQYFMKALKVVLSFCLHGTNNKSSMKEGKGNEGGGGGSVLQQQGLSCRSKCATEFQMPLHYPRYKKADYERMEERNLDMLLNQYGLCYEGTLDEKRSFAMGAFLWPDQM